MHAWILSSNPPFSFIDISQLSNELIEDLGKLESFVNLINEEAESTRATIRDYNTQLLNLGKPKPLDSLHFYQPNHNTLSCKRHTWSPILSLLSQNGREIVIRSQERRPSLYRNFLIADLYSPPSLELKNDNKKSLDCD